MERLARLAHLVSPVWRAATETLVPQALLALLVRVEELATLAARA
jgi:hypothetical protein